MWEQEPGQGWVGRWQVSRQRHGKRNQENRTDSRPRSRQAGPTQVCHLTPLPRTATLPSQAPQRSLPGPGVPAPGGALGHRGRLRARRALTRTSPPFLSGRLVENCQHHSRSLHASSSPAQAPPPPEAPLVSRLTPTPSLPHDRRCSPRPMTASARLHSPASPAPAPPSRHWRPRHSKVAAATR